MQKRLALQKKNNKRFVSFVIFFFLIWHKTDHSGTIQHIINVLLQDGTMLFIFAYVWLLHFRENRHHVKRKTGMVNFDWLTSDCIYYYILRYMIPSVSSYLWRMICKFCKLACRAYLACYNFFSKNNGFQKEWKCATFMMIDTDWLSSSSNMHQGWIMCLNLQLKSYKCHKMHFLPRSKLAVERILMVGVAF